MLGINIVSWIRFFLFGLLAGLILCFVRFEPIALLARIAAGSAFFGLLFTLTYAKSYEPEAWRRLRLGAVRSRHALGTVVHGRDSREERPLLSP